jgi:hypothetical protein
MDGMPWAFKRRWPGSGGAGCAPGREALGSPVGIEMACEFEFVPFQAALFLVGPCL